MSRTPSSLVGKHEGSQGQGAIKKQFAAMTAGNKNVIYTDLNIKKKITAYFKEVKAKIDLVKNDKRAHAVIRKALKEA